MKLLNHHSWKKLDYHFKHWKCSKCGAERYWDSVLQRMMFQKGGKTLYMTPDCNSIINCDPIYKEL
jgi:NAD-dependent SIR2 family protein deacetylase